MTPAAILDETTRPKAPAIEGVTPSQRLHGQRLAGIHRLHLQQLERVEALMRRIEEGEGRIVDLGGAISGLQMASNYRRFGTLCGQECQILTFHHTSEDQLIFPELYRRGGEGLRRVIDRLVEEHGVVHRLIEELEVRALRAVAEPGDATFARLKRTFVELDQTVRSHFGYEETELEDALGAFNVPL